MQAMQAHVVSNVIPQQRYAVKCNCTIWLQSAHCMRALAGYVMVSQCKYSVPLALGVQTIARLFTYCVRITEVRTTVAC
jgi:hypothetical protein